MLQGAPQLQRSLTIPDLTALTEKNVCMQSAALGEAAEGTGPVHPNFVSICGQASICAAIALLFSDPVTVSTIAVLRLSSGTRFSTDLSDCLTAGEPKMR